MKQNTITSEIITNLKTNQQQTGNHYLENGYEMPLSTSENEFLNKMVVPSLFKKDVDDCMKRRIYEIKFLQYRPDFNPNKNIDQELGKLFSIWFERMTNATRQDVAVSIETIASTLSCDIPTDLGLEQYFKILVSYPKVFLDDCTEDFIRKAKYRKLPLPSEYISFIEPKANAHKTWLTNLQTKYNNLERT